MATTKFRIPTKDESQFLRENGIDPDRVMVNHKSEDTMVLLNLHTNDDIVIHAGPKSKRDFPSVWEGRRTP